MGKELTGLLIFFLQGTSGFKNKCLLAHKFVVNSEKIKVYSLLVSCLLLPSDKMFCHSYNVNKAIFSLP